MTELIEKYFEIETSKNRYTAKYITPVWAKGFDCASSSCGLCCITELPEGVPYKTFPPFNEKICQLFDVEQKSCKSYDRRPWGCKTYPFLFGVENGQVIISPSVECPSTNSSKLNMQSVTKTFHESKVMFVLDYLDSVFNEAKCSRLWSSAEAFWEFLQEETRTFLDSNDQIPLLENSTKLVYDSLDYYFDIKSPRHGFPPVYKIITDITNGKCAISTNFKTNDVCYIRIKKFKMQITTWNPITNNIKTIKRRLSTQGQKMQINDEAMELLRDYFELVFKRPFLSASAVSLTKMPKMIPALLSSLFMANFVHLDAGANMLSHKYSTNNIDRNIMRELLSFSDGCLLSVFRNPNGSMHPF